MEALRALEDPDKLVSEEDLIILAMKDTWQMPRRLPAGLRPNLEGHFLSMNQKSMVTNRALLGKNNVATAVFAGCGSFETSRHLCTAAQHVLEGAETLIVVHNKDLVWDLVGWFPTVKTLWLLHNVRLQVDDELRPLPPTRESGLEELLGDTPGAGSTSLHMNLNAIAALLARCPKLRRLESSLLGDLLHGEQQHPAYDAVLLHETLRAGPQVRLGTYVTRIDGSPFTMEGVSAAALEEARTIFPMTTYLELVLQGPDVVPVIANFTNLTTLIVAFSYAGVTLDFAPAMSSVLEKLPLLEELSLTYFQCVRATVIARHCPRLRKLSLVYCMVVCEDAGALLEGESPFPPPALEFLRLGIRCTDPGYLTTLIACCSTQVKELWLDDQRACHAFVRSAVTAEYPVLGRLMLNTNAVASEFLKPTEHSKLLKNLPALTSISTDSYGLRLLFWHYVSPPGKVALSWSQCTVCAAEFPGLSEVQHRLWARLANKH